MKSPGQNFPSSVVIIDSENDAAKNMERLLRGMGVFQTEICTSGFHGLNAIRSGAFDCAIIDWRVKGSVPCFAAITRIRRNPKTVYFPLLIATGITGRDELKFINDFPCIRIVDKPISQLPLRDSLNGLIAEEKWYRKNELSIGTAFDDASINQMQSTEQIRKIIAQSPNPTPLAMIAARMYGQNGQWDLALRIYDEILKREPRHIQALNEKAKIYSSLGRKREAFAVLLRAFDVSPKNIERLALMGDLEITLRQPNASIEHFKTALGLDGEDLKSRIGVKVAQSYGTIVDLQISGSREEPSVARLLNNLGVQLIRNQDFERGLKYYLMSFGFLDNLEIQSKVSFNMGLGFKKWGKLPQAKHWFDRALDLAGGVYDKAELNLKDLQHVNPLRGLADETTPLPESTSKIIHRPGEITIPNFPRLVDLDDSAFQEETMFGAKVNPTSKVIQVSLDKIISQVDSDISDSDLNTDETFGGRPKKIA